MSEYVNDFNTIVKTYYKELKAYKPISREEEKSLIKKAKKNNIKAKNELLSANLRFVFDVASKYKGYGVPLCDLISEGNLGLTKAIDKFDETKDIKFITYAVWWVRQSIQDFIKRRQTTESIEVDDADINGKFYHEKCLNDDDEDEKVMYSEAICSNEEDEIEIEVKRNQVKLVNKLLSNLNEKEKEIIDMYYGLTYKDEMTLDDIGKRMGISKERVRQIKHKILRKMRTEVLSYESIDRIFK